MIETTISDAQGLSSWLESAANVITVLTFVALVVSAAWAWRRYHRQQKYERLQILYGHVNSLRRASMSIESHTNRHTDKSNEEYNRKLAALRQARNDLKNWYHDHRFLFDAKEDEELGKLVAAADAENKDISVNEHHATRELLDHLETRLRQLAKKL